MFKRLLTQEGPEDWAGRIARELAEARDERLRNFYGAALVDPDLPLEQVPLVALDFETTGLDPRVDEIVSIGLVPFSLTAISCRGARYWLVNPRGELAEESVLIHGITHADLRRAPDLRKILEELLAALAGRMVVVHYRRMERLFLNKALLSYLHEGITFPVIDTMAIESTIQRRRSSGLANRLRGRRPLSVRLAASRSRYGLPFYQPHHALTDALATAELFQAQVAHHFSGQTTLGQLWL
ncbi:3'-5' exonuclease [Desulfogranum mediterraneum]|uniref:3'-5' exonuclease n=1 Tax=Desulfogranum mediterraneum TaxID=160661 RepID=UPI0003F96F56|nr:3'-5' exonuclease [Desulfogranum mediterraneum]